MEPERQTEIEIQKHVSYHDYHNKGMSDQTIMGLMAVSLILIAVIILFWAKKK